VKVTIEINGQQYQIDLPDETAKELQAIAARNGLTFAGALQQAIANEKFLEDQQAAGGKLLIEKDDKLRELVREPAAA
jgi:predicted transcriptional regulator